MQMLQVGDNTASSMTTSVGGPNFQCLVPKAHVVLFLKCNRSLLRLKRSISLISICFGVNVHVVQALTRLTPREYYDRSYRLKRACQASVLHAPLPKEQWTKPEDVCLLWNILFTPLNLSLSTGCQVPLASCRRRLEGGSRETEVGQHGCRTKMNGQL